MRRIRLPRGSMFIVRIYNPQTGSVAYLPADFHTLKSARIAAMTAVGENKNRTATILTAEEMYRER